MRFKKFFGSLKDQFSESWHTLLEAEKDKPTDPAGPAPAAEPSRAETAPSDRPPAPQTHDPLKLVSNSSDGAAVRQREEQAQRIRAMFGDYGADICAYVYAQSLMPGGPARLVEKLGLDSRQRDNADLAQVDLWIAQNGPDQFRDRVKIRRAGTSEEADSAAKAGKPSGLRVKNFDPTERERLRASEKRPAIEKSQVKMEGPAPRARSSDSTGGSRPAASHSQKVAFTPVGLHPTEPPPPAPVPPAAPPEARKPAGVPKPRRVETPIPKKLPPKPAEQANGTPNKPVKSLLDQALENISKFDDK